MSKALTPTPTFLISHLLGCSILWASGYLFVKLSGAVNPFTIAAVRGLLGALTLALFFAAQGRSILPQGASGATGSPSASSTAGGRTCS